VLDVIRYWAFEEFSFRKASRELAMAEHTFVDWRNFLRDICAEHFLRNPVRIGGVGVEVQIDESVFVRRKHNVGRRPVPQQWVFGGIDTTTNEGFLVAVPQRNAATLLPIIQQFIRPGTTVVSDLWAAYNTIGNIGYRHLTVNHQVNFVNPVTGAHTNTVENMWMRAKRRNKRECGTARGMIDTYVIEFMWRLKFGEDPFENIIKGIRTVYRV
jgi:transposase-like protein